MNTSYIGNRRPLPRTTKVYNEKKFRELGVEDLILSLKQSPFLRSMVRRVQYRLHLKQSEYVAWSFQPHFLPFRTVGKTTYMGVKGEVCDSMLTASVVTYRPSRSKKKHAFLDGEITFNYPDTIFLSIHGGEWDISLGDDNPMSLDSLIKDIIRVRNS